MLDLDSTCSSDFKEKSKSKLSSHMLSLNHHSVLFFKLPWVQPNIPWQFLQTQKLLSPPLCLPLDTNLTFKLYHVSPLTQAISLIRQSICYFYYPLQFYVFAKHYDIIVDLFLGLLVAFSTILRIEKANLMFGYLLK